eukprot:TRINITY_DN106365_c0_g1_i1.p1 TRINITY_DN106365_c0_g1~~TRINITY_DN106365_c0_g1_i1.p1  ORF type:complete len:842 (+),score=157.95 TRINITY_DN106365_c0_g1_i1:30-2555(+)
MAPSYHGPYPTTQETSRLPSVGSGTKLRVGKGKPLPYGCSQAKCGLNFSLLAPDTKAVWLVLEQPHGVGPKGAKIPGVEGNFVQLELVDPAHRTGSVWHVQVLVSGAFEGLRYGWRIDPELGPDGQPLPEAPFVLDPCARSLTSPCAERFNCRKAKFSPAAVIPDFRALDAFDWEGVVAPGYELHELIIYEAHVRSFTMHQDSDLSIRKNAGTFLGFAEKIPHLLRLGINCVELLPIFEFDETACPRQHPETEEYLCQYWGYQTCAYYAPMQRFASSSRNCAALVEFKTLVRELHRHGIEVILDVVFNHTGEGAWGESNWHCLSQVALEHYYLLIEGNHTNYTGCGNTVNANSPACSEWICDCLRYWALEMKVDGFRFDLASSLTRDSTGQCVKDPLFIRKLANDPCLQHVKLIAEPWDCAWPDGYLVGQFPSGGAPRFAEWNGKFRDDVRRFIKGDPGMKGQFATRICGSADLYEADGRGPCHSINFITAHDGFTLRDLVSYNEKHNSVNNEESGDDNNHSWNCGTEGITKDAEVLKLRERQMRNFMCALLLSAGTPMLTAGDEYGRSQGGNNNTWCQDELNWFSWNDCAEEEGGLLRFCRLLLGLRKQHGDMFGRTTFMTDKTITWNQIDWNDEYNFLSFVLRPGQAEGAESLEGLPKVLPSGPRCRVSSAEDAQSEVSGMASTCGRSTKTSAKSSAMNDSTALLVAFNAGHVAHGCHLPGGKEWYRIVDTNLPSPQDFCERDEDAVLITGHEYVLSPYSCIVLRSYQDPADALSYDNLEMECGDEQRLSESIRAVVQRPFGAQLLDDAFEDVNSSRGLSLVVNESLEGALNKLVIMGA